MEKKMKKCIYFLFQTFPFRPLNAQPSASRRACGGILDRLDRRITPGTASSTPMNATRWMPTDGIEIGGRNGPRMKHGLITERKNPCFVGVPSVASLFSFFPC